jgi:hypothetical protein
MAKMTVCYPNNAIIHWSKLYYDARFKVNKIMILLNHGYIIPPEHAGIVHFKARGYCYSAKKNDKGVWVLDNKIAFRG